MRNSPSVRRRFLKILVFTFLVLVVPFLSVVLPAWRLKSDLTSLRVAVKPIKDALLLQDLPKLNESLAEFDQELTVVEGDYGRLSYLSFLPILGGYFRDGQHLLRAARDLISSAQTFIQTTIPYSAKLGFKGGNPQEPIVGGQERLAGLVKLAPALSQSYDQINEGIRAARAELESLNPGAYPETFKGFKIRQNLKMLKETLNSLDESSADLKNFLQALPEILGEPKKVSYLILFQNDKEIRPTGGFLTAYAIFTLEHGRIISVTSGDMYFLDIDNRVPFYPPAPPVIANYLKIKDWYIRDANLSPDFKESARTIEEFWNRVPGVPPVNGIVAIDTHFVESLVSLLGDIEVPGYEKFTRDNIIYQLEVFSTVIGSKLEKRGGRKDLIGVLMQQIMQKAFSQPSKQYGQLLLRVWQEAVEKHLLFYFHSPQAQQLAENYNFAGRIVDFDGDYLHINDANFAGRKANWYITEKVVKKVEKDGDRYLSTLEISYENSGDYHPDFNTGYRDYVRVFVPPGSKLLSSSGSLNQTEQSEALGKTVFSSYLAVDPKKTAKLVIKYELPKNVLADGRYRLLIQKQPGTDKFEYSIETGRQKEKFELLTDRALDLKW